MASAMISDIGSPSRNHSGALRRANRSQAIAQLINRWPPFASERLADTGAIATLRTPRAATRQGGRSRSLPA
jgi:hypothetical protein